MSDRPYSYTKMPIPASSEASRKVYFSSVLWVSVLSCQSAARMAPRSKLPRLQSRIFTSGLGRSLMTRRARAGRDCSCFLGAIGSAPFCGTVVAFPYNDSFLVVTRGPKTLEVVSCL